LGPELSVEFEDERAASWDVVFENFLLVHTSQVLYDGAQGVSMSDNENVLTLHDMWADRVVPVWKHTVDRGLERLSSWENRGWQVSIALIVNWVSLVGELQLGRRNVVAASPLEHLLLAVLLGSLSLVQALESTVVALVESPGLVVGDPQVAHLSTNGVVSGNVVVDIDRKELVYHFWGSFWPSLANAFRAFFEHTVLTKIREGLETLLSETIPDKVNGFFEHSDGKSNLPVVNWTIDWEAPEALTVSNYGFEVGVKGLFFDSEIGEEPPAVDIPELPSYIEGNPAGF
jgi:hypothetical protein